MAAMIHATKEQDDAYATLSLQNGDDIKIVSENLGHATVVFTRDVSGHVSEKMKSDSAARMEAYNSSQSKSPQISCKG